MMSASPAPLTIVVLSLSIETLFAVPNISIVVFSNVYPLSSEITVPPVKIAISSNIAFLLSPKPGAFTAAILRAPLNLFTTKVERASPSTSSAMINNGFPDCATGSKTGSNSFKEETFLSYNKMYGESSSTSIFSGFVTK
ncbi:hypothetical protein D3C84_561460 [compost metagenome]